jgi:hypothetical protein
MLISFLIYLCEYIRVSKIVIDVLSRPGCYMCHRKLLPCNVSSDINRLNNTDSENASILEQLRDYPSDEDEILATWTTRASLWDSLNGGGGGRVRWCLGRGIGYFR